MKLLLEARADVNAQDDQGRPALHGSATRYSKESLMLLLAAGANIRLPDNQGCTVLHVAAARLCHEPETFTLVLCVEIGRLQP